jgi:nucleoside-diphosphate-sugar epimerase
MSRVVITGASGFVGKALCKRFMADGHDVTGTIHSARSAQAVPGGTHQIFVKDLSPETDWSDGLKNADIVVHLAARVHVVDDTASDPLFEFRKVNLQGTKHLAEAAMSSGVKRFIYLSSIKVNGEATPKEAAFSEDDKPRPRDPYGVSKLETEEALRAMIGRSPMEIVIIRPPLVYGPEVTANARRLFASVYKNQPFPLASVNNKRSLIYLGNLVDAITTCAFHPKAAGQLYLVSDGEDLSTPDLIRRIAAAFGGSPRLFHVPVGLMTFAAALLGKRAMIHRLTGSLRVNHSKITRELGWQPPFTTSHGIGATAEWYLQSISRNTKP